MVIAGLTRWPIWRRWFGAKAERAAEQHLKKLGYRILGRNVQLHPGELDLIARDGDVIVFVEVRSTESGSPEGRLESIDHVKQKKLTALASAWLQKHRLMDRNARFDVIAVAWPAAQSRPTILHIPDAFPPTGRFQMFM